MSPVAGSGVPGIAIIGLACRFPGARNADAFWANLAAGIESTTFFGRDELMFAGVPADRLDHPYFVPAAPVLAAHDAFDAGFFEYSPREAVLMDPQQRQFLEVAWEAFESAGYDPLRVPGAVGVYGGAGGLVSSQIVRHDDPALRGQTGDLGHIGNDRDFLCSRVSFKLNLRGPSVNVQSACSTSLVAVHMACQSLLQGETDLALAGASVVRIPHIDGYLAEPGNIYSPDGHCRAFDAHATGTLFGSGVAAVLLKPLDRALADGDCIRAVIRGTAVTNDGAAKVNFTASTARSQAQAMSEALALSGVDPDTIGYVEAHGTGTALGDPVEVQALSRAFRHAGARRKGYCTLGAVKTNFGHLEQCAGMAGLIKAVLSLETGQIPPTLHFRTPNPRIPFERSPFRVNDHLVPFAEGDGPRRAGVNSVGMGGTNAFAVLEAAPAGRPEALVPRAAARPRALGGRRGTHPELTREVSVLCVSAPVPGALPRQIERARAAVEATADGSLSDLCLTASAGRHQHAIRRAFVASGREAMLAAMDRELTSGAVSPSAGVTAPSPNGVAFLFAGQGVQHHAMGAGLRTREPVFAARLQVCLELFEARGIELGPVLYGDRPDARIHQTLYAQCALYALHEALIALWTGWGVAADVVLGHSVGEFAAARLAGCMDLETAVALVARRAQLMDALPARGRMVAVAASLDTVRRLWPDGRVRMSVAAENGPSAVVVSGASAPVERLCEALSSGGIGWRRLTVSHAFHSPLMKRASEAFAAFAGGFSFGSPVRPWISTLTGKPLEQAPDGEYWGRQIIEPVALRAALAEAAQAVDTVLEVGPDGTFAALAGPTLAQVCGACEGAANDNAAVPSLAGPAGDRDAVYRALARLHERHVPVDWQAFHGPDAHRTPALPPYAFALSRWQLAGAGAHSARASARSLRTEAEGHDGLAALRPACTPTEVLGVRPLGVTGADSLVIYEVLLSGERLSDGHFGYLSDHRVADRVVLPTALLLDAAATAGPAAGLPPGCEVRDFVYERAAVIAVGEPIWLRLTLDGPRLRFETAACDPERGWTRIATGTLASPQGGWPALDPEFGTARRGGEAIDAASFYREAARLGLGYGPLFQGVRALWRESGTVLSRVDTTVPDSGMQRPTAAILDACLHLYPALVDATAGPGIPVPLAIERYRAWGTMDRAAWVRGRLRATPNAPHTMPSRWLMDVEIRAETGEPVAEIRGLAIGLLSTAQLFAAAPDASPRAERYELAWTELVPTSEGTAAGLSPDVALADSPNDSPNDSPCAAPGTWLVFGGDDPLSAALVEQIAERSGRCHLVVASDRDPTGYSGAVDSLTAVSAADPDAVEAVAQALVCAAVRSDEPVVVLCLWAVAGPLADPSAEPATAMRRTEILCAAAAAIARALSRTPATTQARLWIVTSGAAGSPGNPLSDPWQAPLWGLGRSIALEYPRRWGGLVDLAPAAAANAGDRQWARWSASALLDSVCASDSEDQVSLAAHGRYGLRLIRCASPSDAEIAPALSADAVYWITGGTGALGLLTAQVLVDAGARHVVLSGRTGERRLEEAGRKALARLRTRAQVLVTAADTSVSHGVDQVLAAVDATGLALRGVVHAAASFEAGVLDNLTADQFQVVLGAKFHCAALIHERTLERRLDFFVLYSSVLSLWGAAGQAAYAAANAGLDALAAYRRKRGLPATVVNWGPWRDTGAARLAGRAGESMWRARATAPLPASAYLPTLRQVLAGHAPGQVAVCDTAWERFGGQFSQLPALYRELVLAPGRGPGAASAGAIARPSPGCTPVRGTELAASIAKVASEVLGFHEGVPVDRPLSELGLDSLLAVNLSNRLQETLQLSIPTALLLKGSSVLELAGDDLPPPRTQSGRPDQAVGVEASKVSSAGLTTSNGSPWHDPTSEGSVSAAGAPGAAPSRTGGNGWLVLPNPRPHAKVRLLCFPFAGGGAATFRPWAERMDPAIELVAIEPPGRQTRIDEPPFTDLCSLIDALLPHLRNLEDKPYAVYGHCLGALTMYEATNALIESGHPPPVHVFVSGARPPDEIKRHQDFELDLLHRLVRLPGYSVFESVHDQDDRVFGEVIKAFEIEATAEMLANDELRRLVLPLIRAEFRMSASHEHRPGPRWTFPITCLHGTRDRYATEANARSWARFTDGPFRLILIDSEHFLVVDEEQTVIATINAALADIEPRQGAGGTGRWA